MDIDGAKALKERLGQRGAGARPRVSAEVPKDVPPVYQWLGIEKKSPSDAAPAPEGEAAAENRSSWLARAGLRSRPAER